MEEGSHGLIRSETPDNDEAEHEIKKDRNRNRGEAVFVVSSSVAKVNGVRLTYCRGMEIQKLPAMD